MEDAPLASDGTYYQFLGQMAMMAMMAMVRLMENHRFEEVWNKYGLVGGFKYVLFSISYNIYIYGMSSFPLTNSYFSDG